jgi:DNA modification methylase
MEVVVTPVVQGVTATLIAAERTGRCSFGIELDPIYCDVSLRRLHVVYGLQAVLPEG